MDKIITMTNSGLSVPNNPIVPFIEGDGTGPDIWNASVRVFDAAIEQAFNNKRRIEWVEVLAGEKAFKKTGKWLPDETIDAFKKYMIGIKGPLTTPVGGGIRSLNVELRQLLDLYVCLRPVKYYPGVPSPVKSPEKVDMVVFRENTEDVYIGHEIPHSAPEQKKFLSFIKKEFNWNVRKDSGIAIKPISKTGTRRLVKAAIEYAITNNRKSVTLVHKGNIQKFTEGAFREWGYELAKEDYPDITVTWDEIEGTVPPGKILIQDTIADIFLQQILTRPSEFDVIATMNLNGDYISDALAAQVGGIGIAPGANINYNSGHAIFEATHGTAPKYANKNVINPSSVMLSGVMMMEHLGWQPVASLIDEALTKTIREKKVTYDFARLMEGASEVTTSAFADRIIEHIVSS